MPYLLLELNHLKLTFFFFWTNRIECCQVHVVQLKKVASLVLLQCNLKVTSPQG